MPYKDPKDRAAARKRYKKRHPERDRESMRRFRRNNPEKVLVSLAKQRAKLVGVPFKLTALDVRIPHRCPILGIPLKRGERIHGDASPTLDRIVPKKGYVRGNVQVISALANRMKNNASPRHLRLFASWIRRAYG